MPSRINQVLERKWLVVISTEFHLKYFQSIKEFDMTINRFELSKKKHFIFCINIFILFYYYYYYFILSQFAKERSYFHLCRITSSRATSRSLRYQGSFLGSSLFPTAPTSATDLYKL